MSPSKQWPIQSWFVPQGQLEWALGLTSQEGEARLRNPSRRNPPGEACGCVGLGRPASTLKNETASESVWQFTSNAWTMWCDRAG
ncbi:jg7490 [Pararge aegeria aegeria]|uniref:Jg7490 protein n=1 Tax=Pararge aegeria aegeria TaxID=348720 RepID=A0A8S4R7I5_9NEOP|nr:jg7490 [Pararge aegeria aegeria]